MTPDEIAQNALDSDHWVSTGMAHRGGRHVAVAICRCGLFWAEEAVDRYRGEAFAVVRDLSLAHVRNAA